MVEEGLVERFTYISMLTPNVTETFEYNACRTGAAGGTENRDLVDFLDRAAAGDKREISELEEFFRNKNITARIYSKDRFFTQADRRSYFGGIGQDLLTKSLILIDPDRGLEEDVNGDGNLLYSELAGIYEKMDNDSYLMFTQRFPYDLYAEYLGMRCAEIKDRIPGAQPVSIDDLDSIIFFLTRNKFLQSCLVNLLKDYARHYRQVV